MTQILNTKGSKPATHQTKISPKIPPKSRAINKNIFIFSGSGSGGGFDSGRSGSGVKTIFFFSPSCAQY